MKRLLPIPIRKRKGTILVLTVFFLIGILSFVGMSVDLGMVNVTRTRMQATADAAALAAAQEIVAAIQEVGSEGGNGNQARNAQEYAAGRAVQVAKDVVALNGFYITDEDVQFGRRHWNPNTNEFDISWEGSTAHNAVQVTVRKSRDNSDNADAPLKMMFSPGKRTMNLEASATAYIESRDIVSVLDFSGSMNYDSLPFKSGLSQSAVRDNLDDIWDALVASNVTYSNNSGTFKFPTAGFGKLDSYAGRYNSSSSSSTVFDFLELGGRTEPFYTAWGNPSGGYYYTTAGGRQWKARASSGQLYRKSQYSNTWYSKSYSQFPGSTSPIQVSPWVPFPQEGKSGGSLRGKPSKSESEELWRDYIRWVISDSNDGYSSRLRVSSSYDYRYDYGYRTLMMYMLYKERRNDESEDLWRVPAYPFQAVKDGMSLFTDFLGGLAFEDRLGLVNYGTTAVRETGLNDDGVDVTVDLGSDHMTTSYADIDTIQRHKQGGHYTETTNIGDGIRKARELLLAQGRDGARLQMLVMTDGAVNQPQNLPSGLPSGWNVFNWNQLTDWTGDGLADYDDSDINSSSFEGNYPQQKRYAFYEAKKAIDAGITIHTMSVGNGADTALMKALATMGHGVFIEVPGGTSIDEMETTLLNKFSLLAGMVPPARLLSESE